MVWLLTLVVLLPTACLLWFMTQAMQNERLAVKQKLTVIYYGQLSMLRDQLDEYWGHRAKQLEAMYRETQAPALFADAVNTDLADSLIVFDESGQVAYPRPTRAVALDDGEDGAWIQALRLEQQGNDLLGASKLYAELASEATNPNQAARALQAQARCLAKAQQIDEAFLILTQTLADDSYREAVDKRGRLIVADAELRALQLMDDPSDDRYLRVLKRLKSRLLDYSDSDIPSSQRRFLLTQLRRLNPDMPASSLFRAEEMASQWLASDAEPSTGENVQLSPLKDVWELPIADGRVMAVYTTDGLCRRISEFISTQLLPAELKVEVLPPNRGPTSESHALSPASDWMPGWSLSIAFNDKSLFDASADKQITAYLWTGVLVIVSTLAMAALIAWAVRRQIRVARLKNDIVATVSHELKTPLASMRLLIDTLLDAEEFDPRRVREYLHLIGRENTRLSRLIENFLTFSRLEQDRYAFNPTELEPMDIIDAASQAVRDRFQSSGCRFDIEAAPDLCTFQGDADALVTAVVNLLDNAYKYSEDEKYISLRAFTEDGNVCFQVRDNGIGISRTGGRKVFKRFYQVDQTLSGISTGVGLGLSIVRAIVLAHGGKIDLDSDLGKGSTFTIKIPAGKGSPGSSGHTDEARSDVA